MNWRKRERWRVGGRGRGGGGGGSVGDCILKLDVTAGDRGLILHAWLHNEASPNGQLWLSAGASGSLAVVGGLIPGPPTP